MRFLTADYLYPLHIAPIKEGVLQISDKGKIIAIFENRAEIQPEQLEIFEGILCPGFVNAHCHLELSHLIGVVEKGKGFLNFIGAVQQRNEFPKEKILEAIEKEEQQMIANGIVGVGDICNTIDTLLQKEKGNLQYYNFIESFQVHEDKIKDTLSTAKTLRENFRNAGIKATIVPHAPYSVPSVLMKKIADSFDKKDELLSIHMQETNEENQLFENKSGVFFDWLKGMNADINLWNAREKSIDILEELGNKKVLLVHNTFTKKEDLTENYYCTCPKANLYIENRLPNYSIFNTDKLCVGTDSLASNDSLSILEELLVIQENANFDLNTLLKIASKNGAEALGFENLGTFEKGKIPGVNLIIDFSENKITKLI
jgi:cytosine/adenosine deaminase-related metal-dependent hydrolase